MEFETGSHLEDQYDSLVRLHVCLEPHWDHFIFSKKNIRTFAIHVHVPCFAANRNQKNQKMPLTCQNPARTDS